VPFACATTDVQNPQPAIGQIAEEFCRVGLLRGFQVPGGYFQPGPKPVMQVLGPGQPSDERQSHIQANRPRVDLFRHVSPLAACLSASRRPGNAFGLAL
jgi:hypothetical protein